MANNNTLIKILHQLFGINSGDKKIVFFILVFIFFYLILVFVVFHYRNFFKKFIWFQFFEKKLRDILEEYSILVFLILFISFFLSSALLLVYVMFILDYFFINFSFDILILSLFKTFQFLFYSLSWLLIIINLVFYILFFKQIKLINYIIVGFFIIFFIDSIWVFLYLFDYNFSLIAHAVINNNNESLKSGWNVLDLQKLKNYERVYSLNVLIDKDLGISAIQNFNVIHSSETSIAVCYSDILQARQAVIPAYKKLSYTNKLLVDGVSNVIDHFASNITYENINCRCLFLNRKV